MSKKDVIRLSLVNSMNRIYMLNENSFVNDMHLFDVEKLVTDEFLKMFKLIDLNYSLAAQALDEFTSCSSSTSTQKSHPLLLA
ncbi:MAG: hypothetical protein CMO77_05815 [Verrucomicrobiales bacterium]|nr:hypothetical protein [Verrucomicrobiales bacterium]